MIKPEVRERAAFFHPPTSAFQAILQSPSPMMTSDVFSSQSSQELRRKIQSHIASPAPTRYTPQYSSFQATDRGPERGKCSFRNPGWQPAKSWTQASKPGLQGPRFYTQAGGLPVALPLPTQSQSPSSLPSAQQGTRTRLSLPDSEATAKGPPPPFAASTLQIRIPLQFRWGWGGRGCRGGRGPPRTEIGEGL